MGKRRRGTCRSKRKGKGSWDGKAKKGYLMGEGVKLKEKGRWEREQGKGKDKREKGRREGEKGVMVEKVECTSGYLF